MARPLRLEAEGAVYHVIARGNERKAVFRDDRDRQEYLDRLIRCRERFGLRLLAFCLMGNHLHLAVERGPTKLSRVMLALQSAYTQWFNRRHGRVGHLFQGRYKAFLIQKDRYLLALVRYIHRNPLQAGLALRAQDYAWSSDRYYRARKPPDWLDIDRVLPLLGPTRRVATARYRRLMGDQMEENYEDVQSYAQAIKGEKAFVERVLRESGVPPIVGKLTEAKVVSVVAAGLGGTCERSHRRRKAAVSVARPQYRRLHRAYCWRNSGCPHGQVLRPGGVNPCSRSCQARGNSREGVRRAKKRGSSDVEPPGYIIQEAHG